MISTITTNRQRWFIILLMSLPVFIGSLDVTIVSAILPEVITELKLSLDTNYDDASWALSGYLLAYTISMTFTGRLSDIIGRRSVYAICLGIFMFGSWFVTVAEGKPADWFLEAYRLIFPNPDTHIPPDLQTRQLYMFILGRVIQAFGAGAMVPVTMAVVSDLFPPTERARPLGLVGAMDTGGWVLGHLYGGIMVRFFGEYGDSIVDAFTSLGVTIPYPDWRWLFWFNLPLSVIALIGTWGILNHPIFKPQQKHRFDWVGTSLISLALLTMNLGLGSPSPESATVSGGEISTGQGRPEYAMYLLIVAMLSFIGFIYWETRTSDPLLRLNLFKRRNYGSAAFINFALGFCLAIGLVSVPILINIRLSNPTHDELLEAAFYAGVVLSGLTIPMSLAAVPGGWLSERVGYRKTTMGGLGLAIFGFILCALTWHPHVTYLQMALEIALIGIGLGLCVSPISTALINEADEGDLGVSSALVLILRLMGMTLAISSLTIYALDRVDERAAKLPVKENGTNPYVIASFDQMNELYFIGAAICAVALLVAYLLQGGQKMEEIQPLLEPERLM